MITKWFALLCILFSAGILALIPLNVLEVNLVGLIVVLIVGYFTLWFLYQVYLDTNVKFPIDYFDRNFGDTVKIHASYGIDGYAVICRRFLIEDDLPY